MNACQAYIKTKQYSKAISLSTKVLKDDPENLKMLFRRGVAYLGNQDFDLAKTDIQKLLSLDPENSDAKQELIKITHARKIAAEKEKKVFGGMFAKSVGLYEDKKPSEKKPEPMDVEDSSSSSSEQNPEQGK